MMTFLREWILSILAVSLLLGILLAAMPKGTVRQVGALAAGMVLFLVVLRPITEHAPRWLSGALEEQYQAASAYSEDLQVTDESYLESIMSQRCAEYIVSQAEDLGYSVEAEVGCTWSDGYPIPTRAAIRGEIDGQGKAALEAYITTQLDIPAQAITYEEAVP